MYSPQVLDHFEHPRNVGAVEQPDADVRVENPVCGDVLQLTLKIAEGRIVEVRFRAKGCVPAIACGSKLTELITNRTIRDTSALTCDQLLAALGGLPEASAHASHLALDALAAALTKLSIRR